MRLLVFVLVVFLVGGCKTSKKAQSIVTPEQTEWITDESNKKVMRDKEIYASTVEAIPLDSAYITADTLHLHTKKIKGCSADDFELVWNGAMMKSLPPQTSVRLFQRFNGDCKEQHRFHLTYNITPLKMKHGGVANDSASIKPATIVRIWGWKPSLKYEY